jgi:methionyl-tRNA formyltransferase
MAAAASDSIAAAKSLRIAFMGTPDFAVSALRALCETGHDIAAVYCQPPKPAGRGQQVQKTPVHLAAEELGIPVYTPKTLRDAGEQEKFRALNLDVAVVAAYGLILPQAILDTPKKGCINIHASLLPRWRGAAPIQRCLLAGDNESGITIMQMEAGLDTGPMLLQTHIPITVFTTAQSLHDELAKLGAQMIVESLALLMDGGLRSTPQQEDGATYAAKLTRDDGRIDWTHPAAQIERQVRALTPWPGCFFTAGGETIKLLAATYAPEQHGAPGTLLDEHFTIACGEGALRLASVQRPGKKPIDGASLLRGMRAPLGSIL